MSTTVKTGWLNDKNGDKFAPKTLTSQVQTGDGTLLEDKIQADLEAVKAEILNNVSIDVDSELSSTSEKPVQNKVINAEFEELSTKIDTNLETAKSYTDTQMANIPSVDAYTKAEIDTALEGKADSTHNHDSAYDSKGSANTAANTALESAKSYTDTKTSGLASTSSVNTSISTHNTSTSAHSDIRELISDLSTIVNNFLDVDDTTKDQLSEVLTLIENNKGTLESLTTTKVNVSDIIDNLTTANADKVLSANQGVVIKGLIDALQTELDEHTHTITANASDDDVVILTGTNGTDSVTYSVSHVDSGVTAGTYKSVTVDTKGHVTAGSNPTTLEGYGITDAVNNTEFSTHTSDSTIHITNAERTNWNSILETAKTYTDEQVATKTQVQIITWEDTD